MLVGVGACVSLEIYKQDIVLRLILRFRTRKALKAKTSKILVSKSTFAKASVDEVGVDPRWGTDPRQVVLD